MGVGYDARVATAFLALGYDVFPFAAFDGTGRIILPESVTFPDHVKDGLGRVVTAPTWGKLYQTASALDDPPWSSWMAGVGWASNSLNVTIFKAIGSVSDAEAAHQWCVSYLHTVAETLKEYAGTIRYADPGWAQAINGAIEHLPDNWKQNDPATTKGQPDRAGKEPGDGTPTDPSAEPGTLLDPLQPNLAGEAPAIEVVPPIVPWILLGLRLLATVVLNTSRKSSVLTTVWWYEESGRKTPPDFAKTWKPLHGQYLSGTYVGGYNRLVSGIWDPDGCSGSRVWYGTEPPWRSWAIAQSMTHDPWQWCRAFYPTLNCGGPAIARDDRPLQISDCSGQD